MVFYIFPIFMSSAACIKVSISSDSDEGPLPKCRTALVVLTPPHPLHSQSLILINRGNVGNKEQFNARLESKIRESHVQGILVFPEGA